MSHILTLKATTPTTWIAFAAGTKNDSANDTYLGVGKVNQWPFLALFAIPLLTVWGNVLVCLSVVVEKKLKSSFNYFLVSLAMSDMLCALLVMPVSAWKIFKGDDMHKVPQTLCLAWYSLDVFFTASTVIHLCTISVDRYFALKNPLRYHSSRKKSSLTFKIAIAWIIPFCIAGPLFLLAVHLESKHADPSFKGCGPNNVYFLITATSVTFFLPLILMTITYVLTVRTVIDQTNKAKAALYPKSLSQLVFRPNASALGLKRKLLKIKNATNNKANIFSNGEKSEQQFSETCKISEPTDSDEKIHEGCRLLNDKMRLERHMLETDEELDAWNNMTLSPMPSPSPKRTNANMHLTPHYYVTRQSCSSGCMRSSIQLSVVDYDSNSVPTMEHIELMNFKKNSSLTTSASSDLNQSQITVQAECQPNDTESCSEFFPSTFSPEKSFAQNERPNRNHPSHVLKFALSSPNLLTPNNVRGGSFNLHNRSSSSLRQHNKHLKSKSIDCSNSNRSAKSSILPRNRLNQNHHHVAAKRRMDYIHKGQKAVQVLGILFALFVLCYLPFFLCYLTDYFCVSCHSVTQVLLMPLEWVAYSASMLNPIVYHIFNPTFRRTFHQLMLGKCTIENHRAPPCNHQL